MASYAALLSLAKSLDRFLDHDRHHNDRRQTQQIQSLREKIVSLANFLDDFPREAGEFETRMTLAANRAEDIFDYHILNKNGPGKGRLRSTALSCFWPVPPSPLEKLCRKLQDPIKEIDSIFEQAMKIKSSRSKDPNIVEGLEEGSMDIKGGLFGDPSNGKDTVSVVGFEEDLLAIMGRLCGGPSELQVIPIVGMAGIGKTTLARYAYDNPLTVNHLDLRVRVTISQDFRLRRFLLSIMRSIHDPNEMEEYRWKDDESIIASVHKYLKKRRYLIVMDDMWNTNVWDDVRRIFPDDCNGSRIIVTTRDLDVASYVDSSSHPHRMNLMSVDQSWDLLRQKVFARDNCLPELEKIGKSIAENCRGLPLAVVVIAGVLSKVDQSQDCWKNIAENVREAVNTSDEQIMEILSLSYAHLPHRLRPCFLYMGGFPEDHEITVSKLIKLWIAEGFLRSNGTDDLEALGEEYLEDLAKRSLVLINKKRYDGKIKAIKLHDLLRDFGLRKARDEKFLNATSDISACFPQCIENSRRLSTLSNIVGVLPSLNGSVIRTLLIFHHWAFGTWQVFRFLTVVDAMSVTFRSYPNGIEELCFLTYLAVAYEANAKGRGQPTFPESSCNLQNLQTLIIKPSSAFGDTTFHLPFGMWRMPQLRHLILLYGRLPDHDSGNCDQILGLGNLQTLSSIRGFRCSKRILEMMPNLKKLAIVYWYGDVYESGWSEYGLKNLVHLCKLEKLSIHAQPYPNLKNDLSQNVAFPMTLKRLTLRGCRFPWNDMTCIGSLPNLEVLKLKRRACDGTEWETIEEEFSQLKVLLIDSTDLRHWITESSHFPKLERLVLYECNDLSEIPYGIGEIPTLELIEVDARNSTIVESAKCIKEEQQSFGNELKVHLLKSRSWTT